MSYRVPTTVSYYDRQQTDNLKWQAEKKTSLFPVVHSHHLALPVESAAAAGISTQGSVVTVALWLAVRGKQVISPDD